MSLTAVDLVAQARSRIRGVAPRALQAQPQPGVLIDVREPAEFRTGHLAGAVDIPCGVLEFQVDTHPAVADIRDPALSHEPRPVVLYCRTGGRAALAVPSLQQTGFTEVGPPAGGIGDRIAAGLPVTQR